jgi:hypothetical protein
MTLAVVAGVNSLSRKIKFSLQIGSGKSMELNPNLRVFTYTQFSAWGFKFLLYALFPKGIAFRVISGF